MKIRNKLRYLGHSFSYFDKIWHNDILFCTLDRSDR